MPSLAQLRAGSGGTPKCAVCAENVFPTEKVELWGKVWHRACFKCSETSCRTQLTQENASLNDADGQAYCHGHAQDIARRTGGLGAVSRENYMRPAGAAASGAPLAASASAKGAAEAPAPRRQSVAGTCSYEGCSALTRRPDGRCLAHKTAGAAQARGSAVAARFGGGAPPCLACGRSVYAMERASAPAGPDGQRDYHQACFKCSVCNSKLTAGNAVVSLTDGQTLYCSHHWTQLQQQRGGFDFNPDQHLDAAATQ